MVDAKFKLWARRTMNRYHSTLSVSTLHGTLQDDETRDESMRLRVELPGLVWQLRLLCVPPFLAVVRA